jgi:YD repeat-containing protein
MRCKVLAAVAAACLAVVLNPCAQAQTGAWGFLWPYDGAAGPLDRARFAWGATPSQACGQRTDDELLHGFHDGPSTPVVFVGLLNGGACGYQWLNLCCGGPGSLITNGDVGPAFHTCQEIAAFTPQIPRPSWCLMQCPDDQKDQAGFCLPASPKNAGHQCPTCGNPVNPGTGNKFQAELDFAGTGPSPLRFERFYNSGRPALDRVLGGFWQHTYTSKIAPDSATQLTAYRNDGKQFVFTLQSGAWGPDADVTDTLAELVDGNGRRTGWRYQVAATDSIESYSASGTLTSVQSRTGLVQSLVYSDGTNGAASGNGGFVLDASGNPTAAVLPRRLLLRVEDPFGRSLTFGYDARGRIVKMTDPSGGIHLYGYDVQNNVVSVTYPDGAQRQYRYNEPTLNGGVSRPNLLTGIIDENGQPFASFKYDGFGRAIETAHHAGTADVERYALAYGVSGAQTSVTDPLGTVRSYGFQTAVGVVKNTALSQPERGSDAATTTYDTHGNVASRADFNGNVTVYGYDLARNLETSRTEAPGSPQARTISTQWHPSLRLPAHVAEPLRITTYVYNGDGGVQCGRKADGTTPVPGVLCSKTVQATTDGTGGSGFGASLTGEPRTWTYTYNANGSVLTVDGPRTDVGDIMTYTYYANNDADLGKRGNVATIIDAFGHVTSITAYNALGQPTTIVDPNGLVTALIYDARQRLVTRNVGGETTTYDYDLLGQLATVTLPDGSFLSYTYDGAHRLTAISDIQGNRTAYTLDAMGNHTREEVFDPTGALAQTRSRVFNSLNRLVQEIGAQNQTTTYSYDDQGNVTSVTDPLTHQTVKAYDALNRLVRITDAEQGVTQYGYDGIDQLTSVTDPRHLLTSYAYDGLANVNQQVSPDTGPTRSTYDTAGNLLTQTDAKGQVATYAYDALNRVVSIAFHDGSMQVYAYDQGANGVGRLARIVELDHNGLITSRTAYTYEAHGRVVSETRTVAEIDYITAYQYDASGRMTGMTYPSGRQVQYGLDALGRILQVSTVPPNGTMQTVASNIAYQPFGGVRSYTVGNGETYTRGYDLDGRVASYTLGGDAFALGYDAASRITFIADAATPAIMNAYTYDAVDRLTSTSIPNTSFSFSYDAVGNRTTKIVGSATDTYLYPPTSNRIARIVVQAGAVRSFAFDPNGSTTGDGVNQYAYDARGRMVLSVGALGTTTYQVNALGQRVRKTSPAEDRVFHYDVKGRLIAESEPGGTVKREYIYMGDIPVAVIQ